MTTNDTPLLTFAKALHPWQFQHTHELKGVVYYYLVDLLDDLAHDCQIRGDGTRGQRIRTMQVALGVKFPYDVDDGHEHGVFGAYIQEYNADCIHCGAYLNEFGDMAEGYTDDF